MDYTRGIVVQYQYRGVGFGTALVEVKYHLYPIPDPYQSFTSNAEEAELCQAWIVDRDLV
jgi:hypothetical protein